MLFKNIPFKLLTLGSLLIFEVKSSDLTDYDSNAVNASVIVYGKLYDGETYILLAHDAKTGFWTPPGGRREKHHRSILDTAAEELFEETAAYPHFNPAFTKSLFQQQPFKNVYHHIATKDPTDIFALNIGDEINQYQNIGFNYQQRIEKIEARKRRCFEEMDQWKIFKAKDILFKLGSYNVDFSTTDVTFEISDEMNIKHNVNIQRYVFNSLLGFYQKGDLSQVISHTPFQTNHIHNPIILPPVQQAALPIQQVQYQPIYNFAPQHYVQPAVPVAQYAQAQHHYNPMPQHYIQPAAPVEQHARAQYHPVHNPMPQQYVQPAIPMPQLYTQPASTVEQHARAQYHPVRNPMPHAPYRPDLYGRVQSQFQK